MASTPSDPPRICLVGCGTIGQVHLRAAQAAQPDVSYHAVCDPNTARAHQLANQVDKPLHTYARWEDVLEDSTIEGVDLCVPNTQHAPMTIAALRAGKHVLVEKPMALSVADCLAMQEAACETGRILTVMHNRRFESAAELARRLLSEGNIGAPCLFLGRGIEGPSIVRANNWLHTETEGGIAMAQTVHFAYMIEWLLDPVKRVSCSTSTSGIAEMRAPVTAIFNLTTTSDLIGQLASTFAVAAGAHEHRIHIYGTGGSISFARGVVDVISPSLYGDQAMHQTVFDRTPGREFARPIGAFGRAIRGRASPAVTAAEGISAVAVIEAAYRSAREGREVTVQRT
ncbi:MAG: Gfo/Idh/MocA family oxidoreductase [Chloroflexi bacterium]|nr:Gfo/Idh/MocA family oxidoreductase [Chloroflexota bacterium]